MNSNSEQNQKKRFKLFDLNREGKGVKKEDVKKITPNFVGFFKYFKLHFSKLLSVNILYVLGNFPIFFLIIGLSDIFKDYFVAPISSLSGVFSALFSGGIAGDPAALTFFGSSLGVSTEASVMTPMSYVFIGLTALIIFTFGFVNTGATFIIRNMLKGEPVFIWTDFWYAIKRNKKQAFGFGIIDIIILVLLPYNIFTMLGTMMSSTEGDFFKSFVFWMNIVIAIIYIFMRFYIYLQIITFDLSLFKIIKNSLIFALIGWKRNILGLLGIIALVFVNYLLITSGILITLGIAMPLVILFSATQYISCYVGWFKIKQIMIDPYHTDEPGEFDDIEPVAIDRG